MKEQESVDLIFDYIGSNKLSSGDKQKVKELLDGVAESMDRILRLKVAMNTDYKNNQHIVQRAINRAERKIACYENRISKLILPSYQKIILMKQKEADKSNLLKKKISLQKQILAYR